MTIDELTALVEQGDAEAQCRLAYCYEKGDGVEQNIKKAKEWYAKAAKQGCKEAMQRLIEIELNGDDIITFPRNKDD